MSNEAAIEGQITRLGKEIERMNLLYRRALAGDPGLEVEAIDRVEDTIRRTLRRLHDTNLQRAVDRFRLSNLEARFHSYLEMFQRRQRHREEGRDLLAGSGVAGARPDPSRGVLVGPQPAPEAVEALFEGLYSKSGRRLKMDRDTFQAYLERQVSQIREKTGCESVQFRLEGRGDSVKLKARPVHESRRT